MLKKELTWRLSLAKVAVSRVVILMLMSMVLNRTVQPTGTWVLKLVFNNTSVSKRMFLAGENLVTIVCFRKVLFSFLLNRKLVLKPLKFIIDVY